MGLAKKFIWVFPKGVTEKSLNELFGQPNTMIITVINLLQVRHEGGKRNKVENKMDGVLPSWNL